MNAVSILLVGLLSLSIVGCGSREKSNLDPPASEKSEGQNRAANAGHGGESHEDEQLSIKLAPEQIKRAGIVTAQAGHAEIREHLSLYGVIAPNAEHVREIAARFPGVIRTVTKRIGDPVKQGEVLATIESNESLQTYSLVAPLTGVVMARAANPGEQTGDKALFTVADFSTVWVELSLFPRDIAKVRIGQGVRVKSADANLAGEGKVVYVSPFGSSNNQTLTARILLDNPDRKWAPGLYVTAEVTLSRTSVPLAVESDALQTLEERPVVFVLRNDAFEAVPVTLGKSDGEFTEVINGIAAGDTYATRNSFILKAELGKGAAAHED